MNYKVLYRKYRPTDFNNIVDQSYTIEILKNSISLNKISHAYIFAGPRGTGKTTTAKVFAKSINCENFSDNGELWPNFDYNSIDHYSYEDLSGIDDFLKKYKISIENFLFNPCVVLDIYNDNDYNGYDYTGR